MKKTAAFLSFFLPILFVLTGFFIVGIAPFGGKSLMAIDSWGQYFPMLREAKRAFRTGLPSSFSSGLLYSTAAERAYYTMSPLNLLLFLKPGELMPGDVDLLVALRFGLAGFSFFSWISSDGKKNSLLMAAVSVSYALSGWALAFIHQFMWQDALILTPLIMLGIRKLVREKKPWLYLAALSLMIFSNFYIAWPVCIFCCLFFAAELLIFRKEGGQSQEKRRFRTPLLLFAAASLASGLLNLPLLLTVKSTLCRTAAASLRFDGVWKLYGNMGGFLYRLLPFTKPSLEYTYPNLYSGVLTMLAALSCLFLGKKKRTKGLVYAVLLLLLCLSFRLNALDYFWHGFHFPNQLPIRQSFLFTAIVCSMAGESLHVFFRQEEPGEKREAEAAPAIAAGHGAGHLMRFLPYLLTALITAEAGTNAIFQLVENTACTGVENSLLKYESAFSAVRDLIRPRLFPEEKGFFNDETEEEHPPEFFRTEFVPSRYNGGMLYDYYGISYYSSLMSEDAYSFFQQAGFEEYAKNVSAVYDSDPAMDALFSVRFILRDERTAKEKEIQTPEEKYPSLVSLRHESGTVREDGKEKTPKMRLYENRYVLPIAFMAEQGAEEGLLGLKESEQELTGSEGTAFRNALFKALSGCSLQVYRENGEVDPEAFLAVYDALADEPLILESARVLRFPGILGRFTGLVGGFRIKGKVEVKKDGLLFFSLPYGSVRVFENGKELPQRKLFGYLMGVPLSAGTHQLTIREP